jgi:hypothetical protein
VPASDVQTAVENLQQTANSIASAQFVVAASSSALSAERVTTDSNTVAWDHSVAGQTKAHIPNDAVTFDKIQNITTDRLLGRDTASSRNVEEISLDPALEFTGSGSIRRAALTGAVTAGAGAANTAHRRWCQSTPRSPPRMRSPSARP